MLCKKAHSSFRRRIQLERGERWMGVWRRAAEQHTFFVLLLLQLKVRNQGRIKKICYL
jgi:hypothetical protein